MHVIKQKNMHVIIYIGKVHFIVYTKSKMDWKQKMNIVLQRIKKQE